MSVVENSRGLPTYRLNLDRSYDIASSNEVRDRHDLKHVAQLALDQWNSYVRTNRQDLRREFLDQVSRLMEAEVRTSEDISVWPARAVKGSKDFRYVLSSSSQGSVASVLFRAHLLTGDGAYGEAARRALRALETEILDGGVGSVVGADGFFFEEGRPGRAGAASAGGGCRPGARTSSGPDGRSARRASAG